MIVVQHIQYGVSKETKRKIGLAAMYKAPEVLRLPDDSVDLSNEELLYHRVLLGVQPLDKPTESIQVVSAKEHLHINGVDLKLADDSVKVEFVYNYACGAPYRHWANQTFLVNSGEWVQICYNGRFTYGYESYMYYEKHVVNVGNCTKPHENLFLHRKPNHCYSLMSDLY